MSDEQTVDILGYVVSLKRFVVPGLIAALVVLGLGATFVLTRPASHAAYAHVLVVPNEVGAEAQATQQAQMVPLMMRTYVALGDAPVLMEQASTTLKNKFSPEQIAAMNAIEWGGGSLLLRVSIKGAPTSADAIAVANAVAEAFVANANQVAPATDSAFQPKFVIVEKGTVDLLAKGPSKKLMLVAVGLAAGVAAVLFMALLELISSARRRSRTA